MTNNQNSSAVARVQFFGCTVQSADVSTVRRPVDLEYWCRGGASLTFELPRAGDWFPATGVGSGRHTMFLEMAHSAGGFAFLVHDSDRGPLPEYEEDGQHQGTLPVTLGSGGVYRTACVLQVDTGILGVASLGAVSRGRFARCLAKGFPSSQHGELLVEPLSDVGVMERFSNSGLLAELDISLSPTQWGFFGKQAGAVADAADRQIDLFSFEPKTVRVYVSAEGVNRRGAMRQFGDGIVGMLGMIDRFRDEGHRPHRMQVKIPDPTRDDVGDRVVDLMSASLVSEAPVDLKASDTASLDPVSAFAAVATVYSRFREDAQRSLAVMTGVVP